MIRSVYYELIITHVRIKEKVQIKIQIINKNYKCDRHFLVKSNN